MYEVVLLRRDYLDGEPTILVSFYPKPGYRPRTRNGRMLQNIAGHAWISERDHELVRLEAHVQRTILIGWGLIARLHEGSKLTFERKKINDEIWLPVASTIDFTARILLLRGVALHQRTEYSDHKKYQVDTILNFDVDQP